MESGVVPHDHYSILSNKRQFAQWAAKLFPVDVWILVMLIFRAWLLGALCTGRMHRSIKEERRENLIDQQQDIRVTNVGTVASILMLGFLYPLAITCTVCLPPVSHHGESWRKHVPFTAFAGVVYAAVEMWPRKSLTCCFIFFFFFQRFISSF